MLHGETTMSHAGKVNVETHIFGLKVHFLRIIPILSPFCLKSTNLKIYIKKFPLPLTYF
jgi:hypothetical protein